MYARLKSATELQLLIAVLSLFHMFAPDRVSVLWDNCVRVASGLVVRTGHLWHLKVCFAMRPFVLTRKVRTYCLEPGPSLI